MSAPSLHRKDGVELLKGGAGGVELVFVEWSAPKHALKAFFLFGAFVLSRSYLFACMLRPDACVTLEGA
jgi:hypothetical protein